MAQNNPNEATPPNTIGAFLKEARLQADLTQLELVRRARVDHMAIIRWEEHNMGHTHQATKLATALDVSIPQRLLDQPKQAPYPVQMDWFCHRRE